MVKVEKVGIRRKVQFFSTEVWEVSPKREDRRVAPSRLMRHLDAVVSKKDWQRVLDDPTRSQGILCQVLKDRSLQGQFWLDKHDDFPLIGEGQQSTPLDTHGRPLRFPSHFVWWDLSAFPEISGVPRNPSGLLVMERSQQGPRHSALEQFLNVKGAGKFRVEIVPLISSEALERLQGTRFIKRVRARVEDQNAVRAIEKDGELAGLYVTAGLGGIQEFEWSVKASGRNRLHILKPFMSLIRRTMGQAGAPVNLWIKFDDDRELPLEDAAIQHACQPIRRSAPNARSVDSGAMWEEIRNAFRIKKSELERFFGRHLT